MSIVKKELYKKRIVDSEIKTYLANFGAVCVEMRESA